jgi:hypothetical protein
MVVCVDEHSEEVCLLEVLLRTRFDSKDIVLTRKAKEEKGVSRVNF